MNRIGRVRRTLAAGLAHLARVSQPSRQHSGQGPHLVSRADRHAPTDSSSNAWQRALAWRRASIGRAS